MWFSPAHLIGLAGLAIPATGIVILIASLIGALVFHIGWRSRHPNEFWPAFALVSFGSGCLVAGGMILYNVVIVVAGIAMFFVGRYMTARATRGADVP